MPPGYVILRSRGDEESAVPNALSLWERVGVRV
jgi:hypothetical protein